MTMGRIAGFLIPDIFATPTAMRELVASIGLVIFGRLPSWVKGFLENHLSFAENTKSTPLSSAQ